MSQKRFRVAVVGVTGAVGRELLTILQQRKFPVGELVGFASARSVGREFKFGGNSLQCKPLQPGCFDGVDFAFFDASDAVSKEWVPVAAQAGAWVIDNSATFRMDSTVPLLVPEINGHLLEERVRRGVRQIAPSERVFAGPNCSTVELVLALKPIRDRWGLKRVVVSTYQSTSGAGSAAMDELTDQTRGVLEGREVPAKAFSHRIAFNCIPQIGGFKSDGYTSEEQKIMEESRKILALPSLRISATAVRVPTYSGHGESVNVECERPFELAEVRSSWLSQSGIIVQDEPQSGIYPMNVTHEGDRVEGAGGRDAVYVGRLRRDTSVDHGLNFWVVSDNLRKGAALNAVQIGEAIIQSSAF